ncbi:ABC transporter ATP-binding protein [Bradyrhizobium sp. AUGA SZCCT0158]|uniref:ABC transporter ATP-binding protein n=1 Tax=Bradyrhizobium sp. AUGA SZCCT0158 TaxID=2807661 RepID=UPI001BA96ADA|nr:ABC transporter ATP-binding protein [Bradyrhizobium sp. AUGA SZCCT0158]MBR1199494.1 ABC transporter ATP-binding protein [Bradyrhizobium sp. AUGA SZCCT0158]
MQPLKPLAVINISAIARHFLLGEILRRRWQFAGFIILSLIAALIEMTGVGLIFPLLIIIVDPASLNKVPILADLVTRFGVGNELPILIIILIGILMVGKNVYMLFFTWLQLHTIAKWKAQLSRRLMHTYLFSDYSVHLSKTSSEIIRNLSLTAAVFDQFMTALINITVNGVMLIGLCAVLVFVLPPETLVSLIVVGLASWALYLSMRRPFEKTGQELNSIFEKRQAILRQSIGIMKETKLNAKENFFLDRYIEVERRNFSRQAHFNFLSSISPLGTEAAVIVAILGIVTYILFFSGHQNTGIAVLALLTATLFRLTPVLNRILSALQAMNLSRNSVEIIAKELDELEPHIFRSTIEPQPIPFQKQIEFDRVGYSYPESEARAVHDLSFTIRRGEIVGITGASGSGKSTLASLLMGLLPPADGQIRIDGTVIDNQATIRAWQMHIGFVPQGVFLVDDTIANNIAFAVDPADIDEKRVWRALEMVELREFVESLPDGLKHRLGEDGARLSGGQRQRVGIARVLYDDPEFMVFDEATSSLDNTTERAFSDNLMRIRRNRAVVIIAHRLSTLRDCDRIIMLDKGTVIDSGTFDELNVRCAPFRRLVELANLNRQAELNARAS